jgi:glycosyltransferase involved in cell wall biosynthesis
MHIAHFTNTYHPVINGVVRSVSSFRSALTELGHNVFVFAQEDEYEDQEPFIFQYPSLSMPIDVDIPAVIPISPFIDRLLPPLKPEVIHAHHPILLGQAAATKAAQLNIPLVFTFHTQYREYTHYVPFPQEAVQKFLKERVHQWLKDYMQQCHHIVVTSESMLEILIDDYGLETGYTVIPTGIELEPYQNANGAVIREKYGWENETVIISTGRLAVEKNWKTLIKAVAIAGEDHPNLRLAILGDGPECSNLEAYTRELEIADRVQLLGLVPFNEVPAHLKAADIFGFASVTETQGLVTMEALAAGLPVVAVDADGTRDIVQDKHQGLLVDNDPYALAHAIRKLLDHKDLYIELQTAALARAREFEMKSLASKLVEVYERAIQAKNDNQYVQLGEI